jgi:hypothetical protein
MEGFTAGVTNSVDEQQNIYQRKYYALKRKCEEVQQVINNIVFKLAG